MDGLQSNLLILGKSGVLSETTSRMMIDAHEEIDRLRRALRLVMACAGEIDKAANTELEAALECGDAETERQANAWLVARGALGPNVVANLHFAAGRFWVGMKWKPKLDCRKVSG